MNTGIFEFNKGVPEHCMPDDCPEFFTQLSEADKLTIKCQDPDIQEIVRVNVKIKTHKFKIVCTSAGMKLVIHAIKEIELIIRNSGAKFISHFTIPFCTFILVDELEERVSDIRYIIEDSEVFQLDRRTVIVSTVIFVYPEFHKKHGQCDDRDPNTIRCDIKIKNCP